MINIKQKLLKIIQKLECKLRLYVAKKQIKKYIKHNNYKSSMSDNELYPAFCLASSINDNLFSNFRRNIIYNEILEHATEKQGEMFLECINKNTSIPLNINQWKDFQRNDLYGNPRKYNYKIDGIDFLLSPTTLRYVKVLKDIMFFFDKNKIHKIAEIGIGYGGQARIISSVYNLDKYYLFDLTEVNCLAKKYLKYFEKFDKYEFIDSYNLNNIMEKDFDFVISNYAFSELTREIQDEYLKKVINNSKAGYITFNTLSCDYLNGYTLDELLKLIPNSIIIPEEPLTGKGNCIILWGNKDRFDQMIQSS